jgi:hypothetical protein
MYDLIWPLVTRIWHGRSRIERICQLRRTGLCAHLPWLIRSVVLPRYFFVALQTQTREQSTAIIRPGSALLGAPSATSSK